MAIQLIEPGRFTRGNLPEKVMIMGNKPKNKDLFVTDISFDTEEEELRKLFSVCGKVRSIHMLTDPRSGQFRGSAFIRMDTDSEAKDAINMLDGTWLDKRYIAVSAARDKPEKESAVGAAEEKSRRRRAPKERRR